jgi:hypothetical protein
MRTFILSTVFFSALFVFGLYRVFHATQAPAGYTVTWKAERPLPSNHQIRPGDLSYPQEALAAARILLRDETSNGMHLAAPARQPGQAIRAAEISPRPELKTHAPDSQTYFYVLKEDTTPAGGWTEGASVIPCYQKTVGKGDSAKDKTVCIHTPLPILAIHTGATSTEASWLALEVPANLRCSFAEFAMADKRVLFQINSP